MEQNTNNTGKIDAEKAAAILGGFIANPTATVDLGKSIKQLLETLTVDDRMLIVDADTEVTQADPVITIDGVPVAREGDIVAVKGAEKVGKSQFAALLAAAVISPRAIGGKVWIPNGRKMMIFDTEQTEYSIKARLTRGVRTAAKEDATITSTYTPNGEFIYVKLRDKNTAERLAAMKRYITAIDPHIVYIDGIVQLLRDFNDVREATEAMDALKAITAGSGSHPRVLVGVLHSNPTDTLSAEEKKMRGHIGTMLAQSAQSVIALARKSDAGGNPVFTAKTPYVRDEKDTGLSFIIRKDGTGDYFEIQEDPEITVLRDMFTQVAEITERDKQPMTRTNMAHILMDKVQDPRTGTNPKRTKAFELVDRAVTLKFLEEHDGQYYFNAHR